MENHQKDTGNEFLNNDKKGVQESSRSATEAEQPVRKLSAIIFDEKTGTLTLKIATEEEIAKASEQRTENNEQ